MPAITGPVQVVNVSGGVVHFGDTAFISPKSASKSMNGSGSINTGGFVVTNNALNGNNSIDSKLIDQPIVGNN